MEQQTATATETKVVIKRTIPNKQKSAIKLVMWSLSQVMEKDAMLAKIVEMFKVTDTIETIIEMVDAVEKSPEYTMMDTELTAIRSPKTKKRAKVTGDPDAIIKQLVDMATTETATGKKKAKAEGDEAKPKKAPRGKKVDASKVDDSKAPEAPTANVDDSKAPEAPTATDVETEPKKKAPRAKKADDSKAPEAPTTEAPTTEVVATEPKKKAPRAKKVTKVDDSTKATTTEEAPPAPKTPPAAAEPTTEELTAAAEPKAAAEPTTAPKAPKKAPAKKTKTTVESNGTTPETSEPAKAKAPKAPKTKTPSEIVHPNEVVEVAEDLREDEYMLLNEVEVDGKTYMVDSSQNVYNEFNDVIGKYENGVVTMNA